MDSRRFLKRLGLGAIALLIATLCGGTFSSLTVQAQCPRCTYLSTWWSKATGIKIEKPISFFPTDPRALSGMQPSQVIALSVLASDKDDLVIDCDSTRRIIRGIADDLSYEWQIVSGGGNIYYGNGSSAQYSLPADIPKNTTEQARVRCRITDSGGKGRDDPIEGFVNLQIKRGEYLCYDVSVTTEAIQEKAAVREEERSGDCLIEYGWDPASPLYGRLILPPPICCRDLSVLSAFSADVDELAIKCLCAVKGTLCSATSLLPNDPTTCTWSASGGSFPLGNVGDQVIYQAPETGGEVTFTVQVRDSGTQFPDPTLTLEGTTTISSCVTCIKDKSDDENNPKWLPEGNAEESKRGNTHTYEVWWKCAADCNGEGVPAVTGKKITVRLEEVTKHEGVASNWGTNTDFDLKFEEELNPQWEISADGQQAETKCPVWVCQGKYMKIVVSSFDWGAEGKIVAQAEGCPETKPLELPWDRDDDSLPDAWEAANGLNPKSKDSDGDGTLDAEEDDDKSTALNTRNGDGFKAYNEYRSYYCSETPGGTRKFRRFNPQRKELLIQLVNATEMTTNNLGHLQSELERIQITVFYVDATRNPHRVRFEERTVPWVINMTHGEPFDAQPMKWEIIVDDLGAAIEGGGEAWYYADDIKNLIDDKHYVVYTKDGVARMYSEEWSGAVDKDGDGKQENKYNWFDSHWGPSAPRVPGHCDGFIADRTLANWCQEEIAHEVGHAVGIGTVHDHTGPVDPNANCIMFQAKSRIYNADVPMAFCTNCLKLVALTTW